mmetsp:Transcript_73680/g.209955  ORF Transcript_73680/g.209955 Transcript_73680/m.209955 type:complete len:847 (-) Transcript_73680:302-2842(-)
MAMEKKEAGLFDFILGGEEPKEESDDIEMGDTDAEDAEALKKYLIKHGLPFYTADLKYHPGTAKKPPPAGPLRTYKSKSALGSPKKYTGVVGRSAETMQNVAPTAFQREIDAMDDVLEQPNAKLDTLTDLQLLKECFIACDFDGDEALSTDEWEKITHFCDHLGQTKGKGIMKNCFPLPEGKDMNLESFISLGRPVLNRGGKQAKLLKNAIKDLLEAKQAFIACDSDGSGEVDAAEMGKVMQLIGIKDATEQDCQDLIALIDLNGDGMVDWKEFVFSHTIPKEEEMVKADGTPFDHKMSERVKKMRKKFSMKDGGLAVLPSSMQENPIVNHAELQSIVDSMSGIEKWGVDKIASFQRGRQSKMKKHARGKSHILTPKQAKALTCLIWTGTLVGGLIGTTTAFFSGSGLGIGIQYWLTYHYKDQWAEASWTNWLDGRNKYDADGEYTGKGWMCDRDAIAKDNGFDTNGDGVVDRLDLDPTWECSYASEVDVTVGIISTILTCIELVIIYYFEFFMVTKMTELVGLRLWPLTGERAIISQSMTRSIFELGHPKDFMYGMDPLKHTTGCIVLLNAFLYASKKGASKLLIKAVFKKLITRVIAKSVSVDGAGSFADLVISVPVNAVWNALVVYYTLQTCKYVILGPSFAFESLSQLATEDEDFAELDMGAKQQILRGLGQVVALNKHFHVNHFLMANILNEKMKVVPDKEVLDDGTIIDHSKNMYDEMKLDDEEIYLDGLFEIKEREDRKAQVRVLTILAIACLIDGNYNAKKKRLLEKAFNVSGLQLDKAKIARVAHDFANANNENTLLTLKHMTNKQTNHEGYRELSACEAASAGCGDCVGKFSSYCV